MDWNTTHNTVADKRWTAPIFGSVHFSLIYLSYDYSYELAMVWPVEHVEIIGRFSTDAAAKAAAAKLLPGAVAVFQALENKGKA